MAMDDTENKHLIDVEDDADIIAAMGDDAEIFEEDEALFDESEESESGEGESDGAAAPVDPLDTIRILEALLFASSAPLSMSVMRERLPENADVGGMLMQLKEQYEGRGVHLVEMDGAWAFRTSADLGDALMLKREVRRPLSRAAMETLAIVAYHQPVTRAEIENIRGVVIAKGTLDILMECGWVKPGRRRETPGRPLTWVTTTEFLDHFGLESMMDLPGLDDLKASGLLDRRPAIETIAPDLFDQMEDEDAASGKLDESEDGDEEEEGGFETTFNESDADEEAVETAGSDDEDDADEDDGDDSEDDESETDSDDEDEDDDADDDDGDYDDEDEDDE